MATKSNGKKRQSPSVERQLALAPVAVIEAAKELNGNDDRQINVRVACAKGQDLLNANSYGALQSIESRVIRIKAEIDTALEAEDFDALARLGKEMKRDKKGLPPLTTEKKPKAALTQKKPRKKKGNNPSPEEEVPCHCGFSECVWKGVAVPGSACPVCSSGVVADESEGDRK